MSAKVWVLYRCNLRQYPRAWTNHKVESKTAWQKRVKPQRNGQTLSMVYTWVAEGTKQEMEAYLTLLGK